jgi:hypothetical protein
MRSAVREVGRLGGEEGKRVRLRSWQEEDYRESKGCMSSLDTESKICLRFAI